MRQINICLVLMLSAFASHLSAQTNDEGAATGSIVGTWKLLSMTAQDEATGKENPIFGDAPLGFLTYTKEGRMSAVIAAAHRAISTNSAGKASSEEQAMLFRQSTGYAGRYTLTKDGVIHHVEVATDPTWIGTDQRRLTRFEGKRLIISTLPIPTGAAQNPLVFFLVWEKAK